jgi:autotransporter-associated beta strand protein
MDGSKTAATYDEVRIYDHALTEAELIASAAAGPDADLTGSAFVKTGTGTLSMSAENTLSGPMRVTAGTLKARSPESISRNSAIELGAGTILDLGGNSVTAAGLTGGGAIVSNGTLSVTGAICPTGEIVLDGADVSGTLEVTSASGMLRRVNGVMDISGIALDVKSALNGQAVIECANGFTGNFATVSIPSNKRLARSATKISVVQPGLVVIVK